jgi:hypothetical protein
MKKKDFQKMVEDSDKIKKITKACGHYQWERCVRCDAILKRKGLS